MAASLGSLVVSLGLNAAQFTSGLSRQEAAAQRFSRNLSTTIAAGIIKAQIALEALVQGFSLLSTAIPDLARSAGHFQDLSEKMGTAAESVAGFSVALNVTGKSADDLADFSVKLSKNLAGVSDGTDKAGAALLALGLNIKDFKALDPAKQIDALSVALAKFSNQGGGKAAALEAIARGGAGLLPFLKELNEQGGRSILLTAEQIRQADAFSDASARSKAQLQAYAQVLAIGTLPAISAVIGAAKEFAKELLGIGDKTGALASNNAVEAWADRAARALAFLVDAADGVVRGFQLIGTAIGAGLAQIGAIASGSFAKAIQIGREFQQDAAAVLNRPLFSSKLEQQIANRQKSFSFFSRSGADQPSLKFEGAAKADATAKSVLDGQLKALDDAIQREKDALNARADYLRDYFADGVLSIADYYGKLQAARDQELNNVLAFLDQKIAAERAFQAKAKTVTERVDAENKITEFQSAQGKLLRDAATAEEKLSRERNRDAQQYADQLDELNAKMLDLAGNTAAAAGIRFDVQNRLLATKLKAEGNIGGQETLAGIREQEQRIIALRNAQQGYNDKLTETGIAMARVDLMAQTGALTEIDAINRRADLARQYVPILTAQADELERVARTLTGTDQTKALLDVQKLRLEIDQLAAASDVLAKKFNDIFAGALADGITALVNKTKSLKDAAIDFAKSISTQLTQMASKQVAESLFAKGGPLGGVGDVFAGIFGGGSKATEGATLAAAGSTLNVAGLSLNTSAAALLTAATALTASGIAKGAGDVASGFSSLLGNSGFLDSIGFASGGRPPVGRLAIVGEHGMELFIPDTAGTIVPASELDARRARRSGGDVHVTVNVPAGTSRASAHQIAVETGRKVQIAQRRNR